MRFEFLHPKLDEGLEEAVGRLEASTRVRIISHSDGDGVFAAATAVSGLTRYIPADFVPERPKKLRLFVRTLTASVCGACPHPIQNPQVHSIIRPPAATIFESAPLSAIIRKTCFEPGATTKLTSGWTVFPSRTCATISRSLYEEFVQLPIQT